MPVEEPEYRVPIFGEVWEIDDEMFRRTDRLEGYPHFYDRKEVDTPYGQAWIYFLNREDSMRMFSNPNAMNLIQWSGVYGYD